jgi:hypothetical protein
MSLIRNFASLGLLIAGLGLVAPSAQALPWNESDHGDAGGTFATAQVLTGGPWDFINNEVTPATDMSDFFLFGWAGGQMGLGVLCETGCGAVSPDVIVLGRIYDSNQVEKIEVYYAETEEAATPSTFVDLPAGNYYLEILIESEIGDDPPISAAIFTLSPGEPPQPALVSFLAAAPEPTLIGLFGIALAGLGLARRRR